jgi:predicted DNA-binding protein (MmcQ/YjbR family)
VLKDYDFGHSDLETFKIGGQTFAVRANVPRESMVKLAKIDDDDERVDAFFRAVLIKKDRQRFLDLLHSEPEEDDDPVITLAQAAEIMNDLTEYAAGANKGKGTTSTAGPSPIPDQSGVEPLPEGVVSPYALGTGS